MQKFRELIPIDIAALKKVGKKNADRWLPDVLMSRINGSTWLSQTVHDYTYSNWYSRLNDRFMEWEARKRSRGRAPTRTKTLSYTYCRQKYTFFFPFRKIVNFNSFSQTAENVDCIEKSGFCENSARRPFLQIIILDVYTQTRLTSFEKMCVICSRISNSKVYDIRVLDFYLFRGSMCLIYSSPWAWSDWRFIDWNTRSESKVRNNEFRIESFLQNYVLPLEGGEKCRYLICSNKIQWIC